MTDNINKKINTKQYHIFYKNKQLKALSAPTISKLEENIKNHINSPKINKKVYVIRIKVNPDSNTKALTIVCTQNTINSDLNLYTDSDDNAVTVIYSKKELDKYGFEISHIKKIISVLKKDKLDYEKQFINITDIL